MVLLLFLKVHGKPLAFNVSTHMAHFQRDPMELKYHPLDLYFKKTKKIKIVLEMYYSGIHWNALCL